MKVKTKINKSFQKTTQLAGKGWLEKKTIFKYYRLNIELKHCCKWQSMTWLWCRKIVKLKDGVCAIKTSSFRLVWRKYESYILHAESLRSVWTKYESYILHTSAFMYIFQNLKYTCKWQSMTWPWPRQVKLRKGCVLLKGLTYMYPKVGVGQILKQHLEYFSSYEHFSKLKRRAQTWV